MSTFGHFHFRWKWGNLILNIVGTGSPRSTEGSSNKEAGQGREKMRNVALVVSSEVDVAVEVEASHWRWKRLLRGPPSGIMEVVSAMQEPNPEA
jgi:hypothetical protein